MGNQQESKHDILLENIPNNIKLNSNIKEKEIEFIKDIHLSYEDLNNKYGLTRDQIKKNKRKVYNIYENNIPNGFKPISNSKIHAVNKHGEVINLRRREYLKPHLNRKGYPSVCLKNKHTKTVHRLVAEAFIPNPDNKPQVNHIDGNKTNNCVNNLEWVNESENMRHAFKNGLIDTRKISSNMTGSKNHRSKLDEKEVLEIKDLCHCNADYEIAPLYGVSRSIINMIRHNKIWKHV